MSRSRRRRLTVTLSVFTLILYTLFCALAPLPHPQVQLAAGSEKKVTASDKALRDWLQSVGEPEIALSYSSTDAIWQNHKDARVLASVTKLVTALVGLEKQPLEGEGTNLTHVWNETDQQIQDGFITQNGVVFPVAIGTEIPVRLMLEIALIGSGNDFATAYATQAIGAGKKFRTAVKTWAKKHGISTLNIYEPSGMDSRNKASAADIVRISKLALAQPTIASIVRERSVTLPWNGEVVESTNPLFKTVDGVAGLKTGYTDVAGFNLAGAQHVQVHGRKLTLYATLLGGSTSRVRRELTTAGLQTLAAAVTAQTIVKKGEKLGTAKTADGRTLSLRAAATASAVLTPGESASRSIRLDADLRGKQAGDAVGTLTVTSPTGKQTVKVTISGQTQDPGFWWRLGHPLNLFP